MVAIVVAEDDHDILMVVQRLLTRAGHDVVPTADGAEAWEAIQRQPPDLVVSDISMPRMSGTELCRLIRTTEVTRDIPVLIISGHLIPGDTAAVEHATAVLRKPFLAREFASCVDKVLQTGHVEGQGPAVCP
ncbi:response regulator [Actinoplanes subglobosus]|uniref:Response regulator n=1 Tax=Actinoplanes subglobosus TaxID=1547892 RepID=A0ABV8IQU7_9ACTN